MDIQARREAQSRVDRIASFREELAELEREGALILTPEQRQQLQSHLDPLLASLAQRFGADVTASAKRISWGIQLASLLGTAALFAAVVLFLHRVWGYLPTATQVVVLTATPLVVLAAAELTYRRIDLYFTWLLVVAAVVGFVMGLTQLGTVLGLAPSPHAFLSWGLFGVLTGYAYGLRLPLGAGLFLLCLYVEALVVQFSGGFFGNPVAAPAYLLYPAAAIYAQPWIVRGKDTRDFHLVYRLCGAGVGLLALLLLSTSGDLCCAGLSPRTLEGLYQVAGILLSAAVVSHGVWLGRGGLVNLGAVAFIVFLYARLYAWCWHWMPKYVFFLTLGMTALALLFVFRRLRQRLGERTAR